MEIIKENGRYERVLAKDLWKRFESEESAIEYLWGLKLGSDGFLCECGSRKYWTIKSRKEVRECTSCSKQHRVRTGTIFENSKLSLLVWMRALLFVTQDKRGVSALQLKRMLGLNSMATSWLMLMKIRKALMSRDELYQLKGIVELDGAYFVNDVNLKQEKPFRAHTKSSVFVAVEQKPWVDENGKKKHKAGFAKVMIDPMGQETKAGVHNFVRQSIKATSFVKTDGKFKNLPGVRTESKSVYGDRKQIDEHLPWVHKFISNAKRWMMGTHHGKISSKYLGYYLGEYTYRFNRRHDPNSLFFRSLSACILSKPITAPALTGNA